MLINEFVSIMSDKLLVDFVSDYSMRQQKEGENKWPKDLSIDDWFDQFHEFLIYYRMKDNFGLDDKRELQMKDVFSKNY